MKKSDVMYEAACLISEGKQYYTCHAVESIDSLHSYLIKRDIMQDVASFAASEHNGVTYTPNNFFSAVSDENIERASSSTLQTLRAMYALFMHEYYLSEGE